MASLLPVHRVRGNRATNVSHHPRLVSPYLLRLGAAAFIPEILEEQGISMDAALRRAGFSRRSLAEPEHVVPLTRLGQVFKSGAAATAQTEFGLLVGLRAGSRLTDWGQGPTPGGTHVSAALMRLISRPAIFPNALITLSVSGNTCTLGCVAPPRNVIARDQLTDCTLGFAVGALRVLCGPRWRAWCFRFAHGPPPDPSRHAALCRPRFHSMQASPPWSFRARGWTATIPFHQATLPMMSTSSALIEISSAKSARPWPPGTVSTNPRRPRLPRRWAFNRVRSIGS